VIVYSLDELLHRDTPLSALAWKWLRALICAVLGYALYAVVNRILLSVQHVSLADYQGISALNGGLSGGFTPLLAAKQCLIDFAYFFIGPLHRMNVYSVLNLFMLVLLVCGALARIVRRKLWRLPARLICFLLFALFIPFVCYAIYFLTPDVSYHMLMQCGLYFVYALLLVFYDRAGKAEASCGSNGLRQEAVSSEQMNAAHSEDAYTRHGIVWQWLCILVCSLIVYNFILIANICYRTQETSVARSMNEIARLADTIAADPALRECESIAVIGTREGNDTISLNLPPDMTGFSDGYLMTHALHYSLLLDRYHGLSFTPMNVETTNAFAENEIVRDMPCYPEDGYIRAVSGTLVIKFSDKP
ncbi:MAG: glucosyltransferase domain-containing protein, partial [Lachnospiraceae bacterium]|nr:glucosyltransferase domain-containing protein [Lachnospiraceae bacterium]